MRHYLLVDDNAAFAENTAEILLDHGARVTVATSGAAALEAAGETRFDAVVTDMRMPRMDGVELLRQLRQVDAGLPALLVTAYASDQSLHHARQEGLFAVLQKPVDIGRMLELLDRVRRDATVALVEDDPVLAENLVEGLRDHGFSVVSAAHVEEAGALRVVQPLCAVVDWRVPGGAFGEALVRLRERFPGLPCFVISGYEVDGPVDGAAALIRKPFRMEELLETLERTRLSRGAA